MSYHYRDPCAGMPLKEVEPVIVRAHSWLARVANELPHEENIQIGGAVFMLSGMDYHFASVLHHLASLKDYLAKSAGHFAKWKLSRDRDEAFAERHVEPTEIEQKHLTDIAHDAVAYINRLGQFHAFARVKAKAHLLTRTSELMIFRNKHTAHRSIDDPRKDDDYMSMWSQAVSMGGFGTLLREGAPIFQIPDSKNNWQDFSILKDHPILLGECMETLEAIHAAT